jgi:hypothetical protein
MRWQRPTSSDTGNRIHMQHRNSDWKVPRRLYSSFRRVEAWFSVTFSRSTPFSWPLFAAVISRQQQANTSIPASSPPCSRRRFAPVLVMGVIHEIISATGYIGRVQKLVDLIDMGFLCIACLSECPSCGLRLLY